MNTLVRISFRQNAEYLMAGQNEATALNSRPTQIPPYIIAAIAAAALISAAWSQLNEGTKPGIVMLSIVGVLAIGAFWFWIFKRIGLLKSYSTAPFQLTEKDIPKY